MDEVVSKLGECVSSSQTVLVIQAENPDGDSIGSSLALEQILGELGKEVIMFCPVNIPNYLRYFEGWDRVTSDFPNSFDMAIIVDASTKSVLEKSVSGNKGAKLSKVPVFIIDHHDVGPDLDISTNNIIDSSSVAAGQLVYEVADKLDWPLDKPSGSAIASSIMSDSLGLISRKTTSRTVEIVAKLIGSHNVSLSELEESRRKLGKKSRKILEYKGKLIGRIEYHLDGQLATIIIPYDEIKQYSDAYNPSQLVLEDLRSVEGVKLSIAFKTYPDRVTGKLRASDQSGEICHKIASEFGGGGHPFAAGFKVFQGNVDQLKTEAIRLAAKLLEEKQSETI